MNPKPTLSVWLATTPCDFLTSERKLLKVDFNISVFVTLKKINQIQTLPKAQRTRGLSSYYKLLHKSWSNYIFRISNRYHFQNLNQTWTSQLKLNFQILTKPSFRISTKIQIHNLYKTSAAKYWPNFSFKILP